MIQIDGHHLSLEDAWQIACKNIACTLSPEALEAVRSSRAFLDRLVNEPRALYGVNTGFGPLSAERIAPDQLKAHQLNLIHHLSTGQGPLFNTEETRAIMLARLNTLARGYSGVREEVIQLLASLLNKNILPEIPTEGSLGASGDLIPLAHMARLLIGLGHAQTSHGRIPAEEALKQAELEPLVLQAKDGLALVNGTSVMTGLASLSSSEAYQLLSWMELLSACLMQVLYSAPEILCQQLQRARGHRGQFIVADRIANHLKTHSKYAAEIDEHQWATHAKPVDPGVEVQDPYSIRCTPQILGAFQDAAWHVEQVVVRELNAATDNPLIFPDTEMVIHGGNFYGQHVSMVSDYLRMGLIKMALLADRQMERLMNWKYSMGLPPLLTGSKPGLNSGFAGCQLLATSLAAEARMLGTPASIQTIPTNANNQDVVSMGCSAAKLTRSVLSKTWKLVAIEALALVQAADLRDDPSVMGDDYHTLHELVRDTSPQLVEDRPLGPDIHAMVSVLKSEEAQARCLPPRPANPLSIHLPPG